MVKIGKDISITKKVPTIGKNAEEITKAIPY